MSTDLKIDLFASDLFDALWRQHGLRTTERPKCNKRTSKSEINENILRGVEARQAFFHPTYEEIFKTRLEQFAGNAIHFFSAIAENFPHFPHDEPSEDTLMSIFLCSCAFVADMAMWCKSKGDDFLDIADKAWAMFVDLYLKEDFYEAGGWEDLQIFAEADMVLYDYLRTFSDMVHCSAGKNVLRHQPHLTVAAVDSFLWFESWPGVDDGDPIALEWVDFCVLEPKGKIRPPKYFKQPIPAVFEELQCTIGELGLICNPYYPEEDVNEVDGRSRGSRHSRLGNTPPTSNSRFEPPEKLEDYLFGSSAVKLKASDPERIGVTATGEPMYVVRITPADETSNMDGEDRNSEMVTDEKRNPRESLSETQRYSEIEKVRPPTEEQTVSKVKKRETDGEPYNKNVQPASSAERELEYDKVSKEILSSPGLSITIINPADLNATNDSDEANMNEIPKDFDAIMKKLGLKKVSEYSSADSKVITRYVSTIDSDNIAIIDGSLEVTPKSSLLTPYKTSLSPTNVNASNTPRKSPITSTNVNASNTPPKSPNISSNVNATNTPRKSPITSTNVNAPNTPRKSPITSTNVNAPNNPRKSPITSTNVNAPNTPRKSPITSTNVNASNTACKSPLSSINISVSKMTDGTLYKRKNNSSDLSDRRRGKRSTRREIVQKKDVIEIKRPDNPLLFKELFQSYLNEKAESSEQVKDLPDKDNCDELTNLATPKYSAKNYGRTKQPKLMNKPNVESPQVAECIEHIANTMRSKYPSITPACQGLNLPQNQPEDKVKGKSFSSPAMPLPNCPDLSYQNQILTNSDEKDIILDKSLTVYEPEGKNDLSRPPSKSTSHSQDISDKISNTLDISSTIPFEKTRDENTPAEPIVGNLFTFAPGEANIELDCDKSSNTASELASADTTEENPFGFDVGKVKKSNSNSDPNLEAWQTCQSGSGATAESSSEPLEVEKKGKKKRNRKRLTRLEQRVKEEGDGVRDVMRLVLVMGNQSSMASFASTLPDPKQQKSEDKNDKE